MKHIYLLTFSSVNYYIDKIKESITFAWKYKFLWVFGLIMALFGGNGSGGNSNFGSADSFGEDSQKMDEFSSDVDELVSNPTFWIVMIGVMCLVFIVSLVGWYLLSVSKGALTLAVKKDKEKMDLSLKSSWKDGQKYALDIMILDLTGFFLNLLIGLPLILIGIASLIFPPLLILFCCLVPFYVLYFIVWTVVYTVAHRYLVLQDGGPWESIKVGFGLFRDRIANFLLAGIVSIIPGCLWAFIALFLVLIPGGIILLLGFGLLFANPIIGVVALVSGLLLVVVLGAVVNSPYQVFSYTYWTKIIMDLFDDKAPR